MECMDRCDEKEKTVGDEKGECDEERKEGKESSFARHLVLSGGGADGIILYGAVRRMIERGYMDMASIRSVHAVSVGSLIAVSLLLGYEVNYLDDYVVRRPWNKAFPASGINLSQVLLEKGLFDSELIVEVVRPLLEACDLSPDITLSEFDKWTGRRLFLYTTNVNEFPLSSTELSGETHPSLPLSMALRMTCCYPMVFTPVLHEGGCYVDGGLMTKCPLRYCIKWLQSIGGDVSRILTFTCETTPEGKRVDTGTGMVEYARHLVDMMNHYIVMKEDEVLKGETSSVVRCFNAETDSARVWYTCIHEEGKRKEYVKAGIKFADIYLKNLTRASV